MKRLKFSNDAIYHLYNRGVEKRNVFLHEKDYLRFVVNLHEFNDATSTINFGRNLNHNLIEVRLQSKQERQMVEILAFCLMPNHYHLMVRQLIDNGITEFMRKLGTGYTNYFNLKNKRVGPLFQGKFKAILLEKEAHFIHLPHYIHLNPLDLFMPEWRERKIKDVDGALKFLKQYRWSSFQDYTGIKNFPTVTKQDFLHECVGGTNDFLTMTKEWISDGYFEFLNGATID